MKNYTITINEKFNSTEVIFTEKPSAETREALKNLKMRWNPKRAIWYGFATPEEVENALNGGTVAPVAKAAKVAKLAPLWERVQVESIPSHAKNLSTKEIAKLTREHIKTRFPEIKFSCRIGAGGWSAHNCIDFDFLAGPFAKDSEALEYITKYVKAWLWSFNYDNSDSMTDYFDRGFYESIDNYDYTEREATAEELETMTVFDSALYEFKKEEEARKDREFQEYCERMEKEREEAKKREEVRKAKEEKDRAIIAESVKVVDLAENEKYIINGVMTCGHGKECNISEVIEEGYQKDESALIKRELHFSDTAAYNAFCNMFMYDFEYLAGFGGTGTLDERVTDENIRTLTTSQRDTVKWMLWDCVAVYVNNVLMLVIDPEGFSYARYVNIVTDYEKKPLHEEEQAEKETNREAFHIPAPIAEQAEAIQEGESYTLIYNDPWTLCATMHHIKADKKAITDYAQYKNSLLLEYKEQGKRRTMSQYFHDSSSVLLFRGFLPDIPEEMKRRKISDTMSEILNCGMNAGAFLVNCAKYYINSGYKPILNTLHY